MLAILIFTVAQCCVCLTVALSGAVLVTEHRRAEKKTLSLGNQLMALLPPCESQGQPTNISDRNSSAKELIIGPRSPCTLHG